MVTILHISDLHFTTEDADTQFDRDAKLREALLLDLSRLGVRADAIVVTGDIAYNGRHDEFERARLWLESLRGAVGTPPEGVFVVPGNHDVDRSLAASNSSLWELHQTIRSINQDEERALRIAGKLKDPFDFLRAQSDYREFAAQYDCPTTPTTLAWVRVLDRSPLEDGRRIRLHGLNSALISDDQDDKPNLLLGPQFSHFDASPRYVNVVLCHHPPAWLMDAQPANDYLRTQAQLVLCGHEHDTRCYMEGDSLRLFAGAVHPNRREQHWEPCYHILSLSVQPGDAQGLIVDVVTRSWRDKDKCFAPIASTDGRLSVQHRVPLQPPPPSPQATACAPAPRESNGISEPVVGTTPDELDAPMRSSDAYNAARRQLVVHFFRLAVIGRHKAAIAAGVWQEGDDALGGQARWARVFERAEHSGRLHALWAAVAAEDSEFALQTNPFQQEE